MAELCIQRKYVQLLENHITGIGPSGTLASLGGMRGLSDNFPVVKEEIEVPCMTSAQAREIAVLRKFCT